MPSLTYSRNSSPRLSMTGITKTFPGVKALAEGKTPAEALAGLNDERFSLASDCASKLYVAYAPYLGE